MILTDSSNANTVNILQASSIRLFSHLAFGVLVFHHPISNGRCQLVREREIESFIISTPQCHHYLPPDVLLTFSSGLQSVTTLQPQRQPTPTTVYQDKHLGSVCVL